jgi:hypothetical protein
VKEDLPFAKQLSPAKVLLGPGGQIISAVV